VSPTREQIEAFRSRFFEVTGQRVSGTAAGQALAAVFDAGPGEAASGGNGTDGDLRRAANEAVGAMQYVAGSLRDGSARPEASAAALEDRTALLQQTLDETREADRA
jgi:hypothetical protein